MTTILTIIIIGLAVLYAARAYIDLRLRMTVRRALAKADAYKPGGRDHIRVDYNTAARLVNWKSDNYPMRTDSFRGKPNYRHPAGRMGTK